MPDLRTVKISVNQFEAMSIVKALNEGIDANAQHIHVEVPWPPGVSLTYQCECGAEVDIREAQAL